jgi:transposase InsO family protein
MASRVALVAENLFLRRQLTLFKERNATPRRPTDVGRVVLVALARLFDWRDALVVKPETFVKWHRTAFRMFWRWKSRKTGRPPLPKNLKELIREMTRGNPAWGEERIADELSVKLGIRVSPRRVQKYLRTRPPGEGARDQRWATFVRNHAKAIVTCDFFVSITATFQILYVFVAMEIGSRRILHLNVTSHPTAEWTTQQLREILADPHPYRFVVHDRDSIFSSSLDAALKDFGVRPIRTPVRAPKANAFCERLVGTIRRECLDYLVPINERHLRLILKEFVVHYNRGRPHSALGPGIPEPIPASVPAGVHRHKLPAGYRVASKPILGGLHHEYSLGKEVA